MLVLKTLTAQPMHGYGIAGHIQRLSNDVLQVEEGSLYPALQRMRQKGWIRAEWRQTPNNQRARYYTITAVGRKQLGAAGPTAGTETVDPLEFLARVTAHIPERAVIERILAPLAARGRQVNNRVVNNPSSDGVRSSGVRLSSRWAT